MKKVRNVLILIIVTISMLMSTLVAFAASQEDIDKVTAYFANGGRLDAGYGDTVVDSSKTCITVGGTNYYFSDTDIAHYVSKSTSSSTTADVTSQITGMGHDGNGLELTADISGASQLLSGLSKPLSMFLGVIVTIITTGMTIFTGLDLAYIAFPPFRGRCENMKQEGKMVARGRSEKSGETKLKFISDEAEFAVNSTETAQTGQSPIIVYFKKRAIALIMMSIVIFILLTGNFDVVINLALKLVDGVLKMIKDI